MRMDWRFFWMVKLVTPPVSWWNMAVLGLSLIHIFYLIYGMYHCLNLVTEPEGEPCAVLIRGAQAVANGDLIAKNRFGCKMDAMTAYQKKKFLNGPGKLCRGLLLTREQNGLDVTVPCGPLYVCAGDAPGHIFTGERIGIDYAQEAVHFPWRFWTEESLPVLHPAACTSGLTRPTKGRPTFSTDSRRFSMYFFDLDGTCLLYTSTLA